VVAGAFLGFLVPQVAKQEHDSDNPFEAASPRALGGVPQELENKLLNRKQLTALKVLGTGQFGQVRESFKGQRACRIWLTFFFFFPFVFFLLVGWLGGWGRMRRCIWRTRHWTLRVTMLKQRAVKMLRGGASAQNKESFPAREASIQSTLEHENVVALVGVAVLQTPWLVVLEYMQSVEGQGKQQVEQGGEERKRKISSGVKNKPESGCLRLSFTLFSVFVLCQLSPSVSFSGCFFFFFFFFFASRSSLLMPGARYGDLRDVLQAAKERQVEFTVAEHILCCQQVACGMQYLGGNARLRTATWLRATAWIFRRVSFPLQRRIKEMEEEEKEKRGKKEKEEKETTKYLLANPFFSSHLRPSLSDPFFRSCPRQVHHNNTIKIGDFGLARQYDQDKDHTISHCAS
jgi:hypothetical protein